MRANFFIFLLTIFLVGCSKKADSASESAVIITKSLRYSELDSHLEVYSGKHTIEIPRSKLPFKRTVFLNASLLGYITALHLESSVVGVSSPEYIYSSVLRSAVEKQQIQNVGNEQKYDVEKILSLQPDAVFTNYLSSFESTYKMLRDNGVTVIFLDEYKESVPLDKTKYLLLFGKLFNKEKQAQTLLESVTASYNTIRSKIQDKSNMPQVLVNEMYGNHWFVPGNESQLANFIAHAGGKYIFSKLPGEQAVPLSFEQVLVESNGANVWINAGNHLSRKQMLALNPLYSKLDVFNNGRIYSITGRIKGKSNDFFESGVVRADIVLKDYIRIFHPDLVPGGQLFYLKEIK